MVAAAGGAAGERGVRIGVLMGTAYLFTRRGRRRRARSPSRSSEAALACDRTVLLESGPGHATRCAAVAVRRGLRGREAAARERGASTPRSVRQRLEELNIGRLRIASKGTDAQRRLRDRPDRAEADRDRPRPPVGRGHVHDRPGRGPARRGHARSPSCTRDVSTASGELLERGRSPSTRPRTARRRRRRPTSRSSAWPASCPGRPTLGRSGRTSSTRSTRSPRSPPTAGTGGVMYDADRSAPDKIYSRWGGFIDDVAF